MKFQQNRPEEPEINLTSLIDVVFLLLIFFMVSTTFNRTSELSIQLPEADGTPLVSERKVIDIAIDAQGRYFVNQQELLNTQVETLKQALQKAAEGSSEPQLILSADRMTPHQAVISAMDAARQLGFVNLTFATSTGEQP
ncbi:MAG TPA: biopolymer transporter ExbD [Gammaproteobacteria bacterium]